jgi:arylformamidase
MTRGTFCPLKERYMDDRGKRFTELFARLQEPGQVVDLSMNVEEHWRFKANVAYRQAVTANFSFHSTDVSMPAHAFTHVDAPWHVYDDGETMADVGVDRLWGEAAIIDVSDLGDNVPIDAQALGRRSGDLHSEDIILLRSNQESRNPTTTREYWTEAPYLTESGATWLLETGAKAVGFDFPQDRAIRSEYVDHFEPHPAGISGDWPCHHILGKAGVIQVEYLTNLSALSASRVLFFALPIKIGASDGAPVRAFALQ